MKVNIPTRVCDRANHGKAGVFIEQTIAHNEGRTPAFLFVA
jgi:hypothetical protein